ncbi:AbrB/MazE/SpoVT family DNA-binding domain-containing protein [Halorhabdus salina]|uniref:AbrB/MazE/SpoVT family DNA-binding domain-containing protein n=1 Tax=Halorhabdus salina TaxID=2750670 RepID=UPI00215D796D|nr:AbrB/MazE/SpoVT family DNA-binding domain-containing protein [Halorhabdus salina]
MPRVTNEGRVTIPTEIRETLGIEPGNEITFERTAGGLRDSETSAEDRHGRRPVRGVSRFR